MSLCLYMFGMSTIVQFHIYIYIILYYIYIYTYNITTLLRGGRTQIARHNLEVFEGGGLVNVSKHLFF